MRAGSPVNADPNQVAVLDTNEMPWEATEHRGVSRKVLEFVSDPKKGRETALLKFEAGAKLPAQTLEDRLDIYVLQGTLSDGATAYGPETFVRIQPGSAFAPWSKDGCTIYAKWRVPIRPGASGERLVIDTKTANWLDFPHRGAKVLHLYRNTDGIETGRIGNVYPGRKIPSHDHSIGEETFVLEGCLSDEYAAYRAGVWFRMPCGKPHAPFTGSENAKMLIREGDLVW
jgi:anti-sigma factor ChrR (cupin superfamily)